ncbi:8-oxo-dGTP diphosphatase [Saccharopolyspora erythraea NRRL 2338]|uniref:DNA hydrolase with MutT domain n=2 Tax=Saccharopolyspora erythraea TaxID=1836 RepID=A4F8T9_SACEN|nr:NUDIX hydrolase [Saccharopolyspora erythraea]EQD86782.1 DNA hydrolase [Saccharopolyspora erythraea D]PFG94259.1 8-oxo-dGTP diphosphatase [Saccharopolyspora erythraea NRRL 2338]QRK91031.1 NUDIX hydrolase [Saccharopolyspora erythraea]CAM00464.1 DNA hydrolase with MutT domain [Saccharopolyspora erythraea NRRL 2338]
MSEITTAHLTTDIVTLAPQTGGELHVLLIRRNWPPFAGYWALPGGYVDTGETFAQAAYRELAEETGVTAHRLVQVGVYDAPHRDPRGRVVSVAFLALLDTMATATAGDDARDAQWTPVAPLLARPNRLAFDHRTILTDALDQILRELNASARTFGSR